MGKEGERERNIYVWEKHQFVASCMCSDQQLNQQPFGLQANTQSTEPYQSGQIFSFLSIINRSVVFLSLILVPEKFATFCPLLAAKSDSVLRNGHGKKKKKERKKEKEMGMALIFSLIEE